MQFEAESSGPGGFNGQQSFLHPLAQIDPDRIHVANDLLRRFLECEENSFFPAPAGRIHKMSRKAGLSGSSRACHQYAAAAKVALAAEHLVKGRYAARHPLCGSR